MDTSPLSVAEHFNAETGFIYFDERYYDPKTLCWLTPDPKVANQTANVVS
jgi:RHS repeat-associated protein